MDLIELFCETAKKYPEKEMLTDFYGDGKTLTYGEFDALSGKAAGKLHSLGCKKGDFVIICMPRRVEYMVAYFGAMKAGCVVVPLVPDYPEERINYIRSDCNAVLDINEDFFTDIDGYDAFDDRARDTEPAVLVYTSGSTGNPKGILHSAADIARASLRNTDYYAGMGELRFASTAMFSFAAHFLEYHAIFLLGGQVFITPDEVRRDIEKLTEFIDSNRITASFISPQMMRLYKNGCKSLKRVITGSERVSQLCFEGLETVNGYGMSEVGHSSWFLIDRPYVNTPIGKALTGEEMVICDDDGNVLPDGEEGEINIRGVFDVCYFKNPELTAATMIKMPDGTTRVRSGDIGYKNENGDIVYVNRRDWMVKINGQRVETLEIETLMTDMPEIGNAAVKAFEDADGQTYLAAYYELSSPIAENEIRLRLGRKLPKYMLPRFFVHMKALPKNQNGKLDRKALTPPDTEMYKAEYVSPHSDREKSICDGFEKVLACGRVGIDDDFFALGGDSIKVLKLIEAVCIDGLTPDAVLTLKTPRAMALFVANGQATIKHSEKTPDICPLTEAQRGVYLECVENPESVMYNIPVLCKLPDGTDKDRFISAVKAVISSHKAFNVTVSAPGGVPSMIYAERDIPIAEKTVDDLKAECREFVRPFDLESGPLCRFEVCRYHAHLDFIFDVHHLVFDGTSTSEFVHEIAECYNGREVQGEKLGLFDIAAYELNIKTSENYKAAEQYFEDKLGGVDCDSKIISDIVHDSGLCGADTMSVTTDGKFLPREAESFVRNNHITENSLFLGAFAYALAKFNGMTESCFCTVNSGRHDPRLSGAVGMFVKTLPLYFGIDDNMKTAEFLKLAQSELYGAMKHDCISFGELAAKYGVSTDIAFIYQGEMFDGAELGDGRIEVKMLETGDAQSDLDVMVLKTDGGYRLLVHSRRAVYSKALVESFVNMYLNVVGEMLKADTLGEIRLTDDISKAQLDRFNATEKDYAADKTVIDLFRETALRVPDNICLVYKDKKFTYSQIDRITDILAKDLVKKGIGREKVVGVLIPRCEYMLICALGVLKAGGAYMPLDPSYPPERLNLMMQDSGAVMLINDPEFRGIINSEFTGIRMSVDEIPQLSDCDVKLPTPKINDLFVMLYTSGSTGKPKGVMFEHSNATVTTEYFKSLFELDENSRVAAYASYGFDAHAADMYPPIISGGELHIIPDDIRLDLIAVREYFNKNGITSVIMTTQIGRQFASMGGFTTLKTLSVAGEKLTPPDVPDGFKLYNLYGPTEGSIITSGFLIDRRYKDVPIGKAVDNLKTYIVDKNGKLLPAGAVGELWIAGPHVTRGYLNRPDKMAEAYGENPFDCANGYERIYRTGDIVRLMCDGNLQFVGRRDAQVKVRGFRVELTEIEEVIRRFKDIKDATVSAFDDPSGGKFIAAYVVSDKVIDRAALADFIRAEKPPYMVPAVTMQIDAIPLNQNQKVNRKALPVPVREVGELTAPETELQQSIFEITADVIGHSDFGIDTDIYEAGLTSIGAVRLNVRLAESFDTAIRIADLKENGTVRKLEKFILAAKPEAAGEILDDYPITETQKGIFIESIAEPDTTVYNIPVLLKIGDKVDIERLKSAVKSTVNAHSYIKTTLFTDKEGNVRAKRNDSEKVNIETVKCRVLPALCELAHPFTLIGSPLYRIAVYITDDGNYLFVDIHHIICDGMSENIIFRDIDRAYGGETLKSEKYSGFDAAVIEQNALSGENITSAREYWKTVLSGCETECLPKKAPEDTSGGAGTVKYTSSADGGKIKRFCKENGLSQNALFNAAFAFALGKFTGKENVTYSTIYNGRNDSRLAESVTMLVKTLPVTAELSGDRGVTELIKNVDGQLIGGMANDICSFAELSREYGVNSDIIFIYQGEGFVFDRLCGEKAKYIELPSATAKAPISVNVYEKGEKFEFSVEYRRDLYNTAFAESMCDSVYKTVCAFTDKKLLRDVSIMTEAAEKCYSVLNDNDTQIDYIPAHKMFENAAKRVPEKIAVAAAGETVTYAELNAMANAAAHKLIDLGVKRDSIIGLVLDRTKEVLVIELAIMKAGGAFLPMIPTYPDERIDYCLINADSPIVITTEKIRNQKKELFSNSKPYRTLTVEELVSDCRTENPDIFTPADSLAYCIYTSGSTGTPKGVMIEHHSFTNFLNTDGLWLNYYTNPDFTGSAMASSSISFDMSIMELFYPLCYGKTLCMTTEEEYHNPLMLRELMLKYRVNMMICTPSFMNNMVSIPQFCDALKELKTIVVGAEAFPSSLYDALRRNVPELQIINGYGPTETTICCSMKELHGGENITIGRPTGNVKMYVVDKYGHILPPYGVGELIICGAGVGRGYVKLPEKTSQAFFTLRGLPAYHSGDSVRLTGEAEIEFGGRIDNQVKLRGFRIELDEIEKVMCAFDSVKQSKVIVRNNGTEDYLVGFFTADSMVDISELTEFLKSRLTYYMVPSVIAQLDAMPLTPNGKIDKNALPAVEKKRESRKEKRAPKKSLEQRLCEIFATTLGTKEVYADDNFFELGGTSLSASKVTMVLMSENIEVKYGDIFDNPTPESLAEFIESRNAAKTEEAEKEALPDDTTREALKWNMVKYAAEVKREGLGNVLLTGAVGFLGIHILNELLQSETGHIYCLVRRGNHETPEIRLKTMLVYYFSSGFDTAMRDRITVIEADITDDNLAEKLEKIPFDTVINCAACVKHFADDDILERINVHGVENLIEICKNKNAKLIQISTVSVPGIHTEESYEKQVRMHENELFVIDDMSNKYGISKYHAELRIFDAVEKGLRAKVIRVGNLMGRHSDGEFQANMETNMFMRGIRGFALMGKYPISHMADPMRFSPVDCTARAVVLLAGTNDKFTAFNADNRYGFDEMKIIDACNRNGITILPEDDEKYYAEFNKKLGDDRVNEKLNGLAAYDIKGAHAVDTDNLFTTHILYRIGFSWPLVDDGYLDRAINSIMSLDFFANDDTEEN